MQEQTVMGEGALSSQPMAGLPQRRVSPPAKEGNKEVGDTGVHRNGLPYLDRSHCRRGLR